MPMHYDEQQALWVATGDEAVAAALAHPQLTVRPAREPVPEALRGRAVGEVFALLVRMNDGEFHRRHRAAVVQAVGRLSLEHVARCAARAAGELCPRLDANALIAAIPVRTMARVIGVDDAALDTTTRWVIDFVQGIAPGAAEPAIARADAAAAALMAQGQALGLAKVEAANRIALMQQACDATAGLIGHAASRLLERGLPHDDAGARRDAVVETMRIEPPVLHTRRWAAVDLELCGARVASGAALRVDLASAAGRCAFGAGAHRCPGEAIAIEIAASALRALARRGVLAALFSRRLGFRPLPNVRIPVFHTAEGANPWSP